MCVRYREKERECVRVCGGVRGYELESVCERV